MTADTLRGGLISLIVRKSTRVSADHIPWWACAAMWHALVCLRAEDTGGEGPEPGELVHGEGASFVGGDKVA